MREIVENRIWQKAQQQRLRQKYLGRISGVFLFIALVALFDGLLAQMRGGANELLLLTGESITISGPVALKNPVTSDLIYRFEPESAPLRFEFEGFFTGYWFGNGMWRARIAVLDGAQPGAYGLRVAFRGALSHPAQNYNIKIFASAEAMRQASLSWIMRVLGTNPFILAACAGCAGIVFGIGTYHYGCRYALGLSRLGLAEIYSGNPEDGSIWCLAPKNLAPKAGNARMVLDTTGHILGEARAEEWQKGKLRLTLLDGGVPPRGSLICLKPPHTQNQELAQ